MSIQSFSDKATEAFFILGDVKKNLGWAEIAKIVRKKTGYVALCYKYK